MIARCLSESVLGLELVVDHVANALLAAQRSPWLIAGHMRVVGRIGAACASALKEAAHTEMVATAAPSPGD